MKHQCGHCDSSSPAKEWKEDQRIFIQPPPSQQIYFFSKRAHLKEVHVSLLGALSLLDGFFVLCHLLDQELVEDHPHVLGGRQHLRQPRLQRFSLVFFFSGGFLSSSLIFLLKLRFGGGKGGDKRVEGRIMREFEVTLIVQQIT